VVANTVACVVDTGCQILNDIDSMTLGNPMTGLWALPATGLPARLPMERLCGVTYDGP
jgi:hypothetical protein